MMPQHRELLRRAVLQSLASRQTAEFSVSALVARAEERLPELSITEQDVEEALAFLEGLFLVRRLENQLGGYTLRWQITTQGMLFCERHRYI